MSGIAPITAPELPQLAETKSPDRGSIGEVFAKTLKDAHDAEQTATTTAEKFANDDPSIGIHEVMIASEKANISIRYATTLKNKAVEAYRELMNTQV